MCLSIAMTNILLDRERFLQLILENHQIQLVRSADPEAFDNIVRHPQFIPHGGSLNVQGGGGGGHHDDHNHNHGDSDENSLYDQLYEENPGEGTQRFSTGNSEIDELTKEQLDEVKNGCDQMQSMGLNTSLDEVLQMYVACGKNINVVIDNMLSANYQ